MVKIVLKWNREKFEDVELDTTGSVEDFKATCMSLTGVPIEKQKLMAKGVWKLTLKDTDDFSAMKIKEKQLITLVGTAEVLVEPKEKVKFIEDMTSEEQAQSGAVIPSGFQNLANTCYMNSTLQCFRPVKELRVALDQIGGRYGIDQQNNTLTMALRDTFNNIDKSKDPLPPFQFLQILRQCFPQFAQRSPNQSFMQQDAEEFYGAAYQSLSDGLKIESGSGKSVMDNLFGLELEDKLICEESELEETVTTQDTARKLVCTIARGVGSAEAIGHMHEGIKLGLEGQLEKNSSVLGRNALWKKTSRISKLPPYLMIQFMRFYWKPTPNNPDHAGVKCKLLKSVSFPETLDVYDFCSDKLRDIMKINREEDVKDILSKPKDNTTATSEEKNENNMDIEGPTTSSTSSSNNPTSSSSTTNEEQKPKEGVESEEEKKALDEALSMSLATATSNLSSLGGVPDTAKGNYELYGVVTHKGRDAESGHYMGWVRQNGDDWLVFDDAEVSECKTEDIMKLSGGGDWHMAYLTFYRFKN